MGVWVKALALTPEMMEAIEELLDAGHYEKTVYTSLNIASSTWENWKKEAKKLEAGLENETIIESKLESDDIKLLKLWAIIKKGRSKAIITNLKNIHNAGKDPAHWQASAWYLERVAAGEYGRQQTIKHEGVIGTFDIELSEEEETQFHENLKSIFPNIEE